MRPLCSKHMSPTFTQFLNTVPQFGHCIVKYLIDRVEKVQRFFTKRLAGLQKMSYCNRLNTLNVPSLESTRLANDMVLCYKLLHDNNDLSITTT